MKKYLMIILSCIFFAISNFAHAQDSDLPPYKNPSLSAEERVKDLLPRMTLEEKVLQLTCNNRIHFNENNEIPLQTLEKELKGKSIGAIECPILRYDEAVKFCEITENYVLDNDRLGIPPILTGTCGHGVMLLGATIFPQCIAMGASWNPDLVFTMGQMAGAEASNAGIDQDLAPLFDLARDPRYGRVEECFGEDPYLVSQMGIAYITGIQGLPEQTKKGLKPGGLICTAKHMAAYSIPAGGLNLGPSLLGRREMRSLHLPPFEAAVKEANTYSIMPSYSEIDGVPAHANKWLLTEVLKKEWGFEGYVFSDAVGIRMLEFLHKVSKDRNTSAKKALTAGVDLEFPDGYAFSRLITMVENKEIEEKYIDEAVGRVLLVKFRAGLFDKVYKPSSDWKSRVHTKEYIAHARKMAEESIVLLKNDNILPLRMDTLSSIAVIGPNADQVQFGSYCVTKSNKYGVTPLEGIRNITGDKVKINYAKGCGITDLSRDGIQEAIEAAEQSDVVILVTGGTSLIYSGIGWGDSGQEETVTCGEGIDRTTLDPPGIQPELTRAIHSTGKPVILVMVHGRPYTIPWEDKHVPAILDAWYPGEQGGNAIARILFGEVNPSGKLPVSVPQKVGQIPVVYNHKPSGRGFYKQPGTPEKPGRDYVFTTPDPLYPFGFGLSYTHFEYSELKISNRKIEKGQDIQLSVKIKNTGERAGKEVCQVYINDLLSSVTTPVIQLKNFEKVLLKPGETRELHFEIPYDELSLWNQSMERVVEPGEFEIMIGKSAADIVLKDKILVE